MGELRQCFVNVLVVIAIASTASGLGLDPRTRGMVRKMNEVEEGLYSYLTSQEKRNDNHVVYDEVDPSLSRLMKRTMEVAEPARSKRPEFMGYQVSLPQYMRLRSIQEEVIRMDRYMKVLAASFSQEELNADANWRELLQLHMALSKLLPNNHL